MKHRELSLAFSSGDSPGHPQQVPTSGDASLASVAVLLASTPKQRQTSTPMFLSACVKTCGRTSRNVLLETSLFWPNIMRQQAIHSSAANEDNCAYSVMQIGTAGCIPALVPVC